MLAHTGTDASAEPRSTPGRPGGPGGPPLFAALTDGARATSARLTGCELPVDEESFARLLGEAGLPGPARGGRGRCVRGRREARTRRARTH